MLVPLHNLAEDMAKTKNLAAVMPENVAEMKASIEKIITDGLSTPGSRQKNDVRVIRPPVLSKTNTTREVPEAS